MAVALPGIFKEGGPMMYFILACSIVALAVVIERLLRLRSRSLI